jgi:hypothetical protein
VATRIHEMHLLRWERILPMSQCCIHMLYLLLPFFSIWSRTCCCFLVCGSWHVTILPTWVPRILLCLSPWRLDCLWQK